MYLVVAFGSNPHVVFRTQIRGEDTMIWPRVRGEDRHAVQPWPPQVKILATFKPLASLEDDEHDALLTFAQEFPPKPGRLAIGAGWLSPDGLWYVDGQVSHDRIRRFLAGSLRTSADLWQRVKPHVRAIQREDGVLILDDSMAEKPYTDENDIVCWHYDLERPNGQGGRFCNRVVSQSRRVLSSLHHVDCKNRALR